MPVLCLATFGRQDTLDDTVELLRFAFVEALEGACAMMPPRESCTPQAEGSVQFVRPLACAMVESEPLEFCCLVAEFKRSCERCLQEARDMVVELTRSLECFLWEALRPGCSSFVEGT